MCTGILSGGFPGLSGRIHNLVDVSCVPCHTSVLLSKINRFYFLYDILQPASHNILMETKEVWGRVGKTCARVDSLGSHGISKLSVCVYCSVFSSGKCMTKFRVGG